MGVRSGLASTLTRAAKAIGGTPALVQPGPQEMRQAAQDVSQMGPAYPFSPGEPIAPYDGYGRTPRTHNFPTAYNVATRPRTHERVSFATLKGLIGAYDVATICLWHRIDSIRSLSWKLIAADNYSGDVTEAIPLGMSVLKSPDRKGSFKTWLAKYAYDILAYDAGALYRMRNRAGRCIGLKPIDGSLIAPLLDYWGDSPEPPAEAYVQYANGLPWNWLTRDDLIYEPFRPHTDSPYGHAPIESIILNANTDLRFQIYFLERFTSGNVPEAFASAPENWTPTQVEEFQAYWDTMMYGDQSVKHQIRWMPGGSSITWSNEKDFTDPFSLFLMRKTCSAFHVTPADMGFTENVNRSSGESQADVQHRVGDLPLMEHIEGILSAFLYDDLGLPLQFQFDRGEEQDDQLSTAQADDLYIKNGTVGTSEIRELRFGLHEPEGKPVPRFVFSERNGPIPLASLYALAGQVDQQTGAPVPGAPLPHVAFGGVPGTMPNPPIETAPLAVQEYGPKALPPAPPQQPGAVAKEGAGGAATGITSETGITSYDLIGRDEDEDEDRSEAEHAAVAKAELAAFRRYAKARRRSGEWRDFEFREVDPVQGAQLNAAGRQSVAKAAGYELEPRSGMISLDLPPGLVDQVPGGVDDHHVTVVYLGPDVDDAAFAVACQRAQAAAAAMPGPLTGSLAGVASFPPSAGSDGKVPAYVPASLPGAMPLRAALADLSASEHKGWKPHVTLAYLGEGEPLPAPQPSVPVTFTHLSVHRGDDVERFRLGGVPLGDVADAEPVAKAGGAGPKGGEAAVWPGWDLDRQAIAYWAPLLAAALTEALSASRAQHLASAYLADHPDGQQDGQGKREATEAAAAWLASAGLDLAPVLAAIAAGIVADGWLIGAVSAAAMASGTGADTGSWQPGDSEAAVSVAAAAGAGKGPGPAEASAAAGILAGGYMTSLGRALVDGALAGLAASAIGAAMVAAVAPPVAAASAVLGQIVQTAAGAVQAVYGQRGVQSVIWVTDPGTKSGPCPLCLANEATGPVAAGEAFPSGDISPPAHPGCACATMPA